MIFSIMENIYIFHSRFFYCVEHNIETEAIAGNAETVIYLIKTRKFRLSNYNYIYTCSAEGGDINLIKHLDVMSAEYPLILKNISGCFGHACLKGHLELVKYLDFRGIDRGNIFSYLNNVCWNEHLEVVKYLLPIGNPQREYYVNECLDYIDTFSDSD